MKAYCTQNTDRECKEEDCCLKKPKCEKCNDSGFYYIEGISNERIRFECECNGKGK